MFWHENFLSSFLLLAIIIIWQPALTALAASNTSTKSNVVSTLYCFSCLDKGERGYKKSFLDLPASAQLQDDPRGNLPSSITICSTVNTFDFGQSSMFFQLLGENNGSILGAAIHRQDFDQKLTRFYVAIGRTLHIANGSIPLVLPDQWVTSCLALSFDTGLVEWVIDGHLIEDKTYNLLRREAAIRQPRDLTGRILLGVGEASYGWFTLGNYVTNLNVFSSALSIDKMKTMTVPGREECKYDGDYISWSEMQWTLRGQAATRTVSMEETCEKESRMTFFNAGFSSLSSCSEHCQKLGGRIPKVVTEQQRQELNAFLKKPLIERAISSGFWVWLSVTDDQEEGIWRDFDSNEVVAYESPFAVGEPNGGRDENCAMQTSQGQWVDNMCHYDKLGFPCVCSHEERPYMRLRGLCPQSRIGSLYVPRNTKEDIMKFEYVSSMGMGTTIRYNRAQKKWQISIYDDTVLWTNGSSGAPLSSFAIGKHSWRIDHDSSECSGEGGSYTRDLKLTGCLEEEFTCHNGLCIPMLHRCDQVPDCSDQSDETGCELIIFRQGYNMKIPPTTSLIRRNKRTIVPVRVNISINLMRIANIDERSQLIDFQFGIELKWYENRARYQNLKDNREMNVLPSKNVSNMWLPLVQS